MRILRVVILLVAAVWLGATGCAVYTPDPYYSGYYAYPYDYPYYGYYPYYPYAPYDYPYYYPFGFSFYYGGHGHHH